MVRNIRLYPYIFKKLADPVKKNFFAGYDLIGCNLEGAVTDNGAHYDPITAYDFAFAPELINQLKNYNFNFFNLANNHLADQGERGIIETRKNLDEMGFNYAGCPDGKTGKCSSKILKIADKKIGIAGFSMIYSGLNIAEVKNVVNDLNDSTDFVIINMHWGIEYEHKQNNQQQQTARSLIDFGADVIIGHHPHVAQGIEIYKNKIIFYSLGNFIFDQYFSQDTQEGLAIGINIGVKNQEYFLYPLKSKLSQVELMDEKNKKIFLQKLISWSDIDDKYINQLKNRKIIIDE